MADTTDNMGLKVWDLPNDVFSYTDLADNFQAIDLHDHATDGGVQIPSDGLANLAVTTAKLANDAVTNPKIPVNTITGDRVVNSTLADTKLASPNSGVWRTIATAASPFGGTAPAATYVFTTTGLTGSGNNGTGAAHLIPLDDAWYIVASKTTKLRIIGTVATNGVAPAVTLTAALHAVSANGGSNNNNSTTLAAALAGSGVSIATPALSTRSVLTGPEFDFPSDGIYALGLTSVGTAAANSHTGVSLALQIRHV